MAMPLAVRFPNMSYCVFSELSILRSLKFRRGMLSRELTRTSHLYVDERKYVSYRNDFQRNMRGRATPLRNTYFVYMYCSDVSIF